MSPRTLSRLSGTALIFGSILLATGYAISSLLIPQGFIGMYSAPIAVSAYVLRIVGATFLLMGLPAVFARQAQGSRSVASSLIGFIMTFLGIATLEVGMNAIYAFIFPPLATNPATQSLLISFDANRPMGASIAFASGLALEVLGPPVLGIAIVRAKVLPRLAGMMLIAVPLLVIIGLPDFLVLQAVAGVAFAVVFGLGFALCGYGLLSSQSIKSVQDIRDTETQREMVEVEV